MTFTVQLPTELEAELRDAFGSNLDRAALESLVIEGYRTGKLSIGQVRRLLGLASRLEAEAWLGEHRIHWNYCLEDLEADRQTLADLFPNES